MHFTYFDYIGLHHPETQKFLTAALVGILVCLLGYRARAVLLRRKAAGTGNAYLIPEKAVTLHGFFDAFTEAFISFQDSVMGKENRRHFPFTASVFLFIFTANMLGLIPGFPAATTTVWVTTAVALVIFCYFNYWGIKEHGLINYIKHFAGPIWWLAILLFPIEVLGTFLRILTLNLRLYWNITADHVVLGIFSDLVPYVFPVVFYALGTFVSFMQAFVPTVLTMVYITLATQHGEEEHH